MVAIELDDKLAELLPETISTYAPDHADHFEVVHG